jgi:hypothetical protein
MTKDFIFYSILKIALCYMMRVCVCMSNNEKGVPAGSRSFCLCVLLLNWEKSHSGTVVNILIISCILMLGC